MWYILCTSCRIIINCTDVEVVALASIGQKNASYSSYRDIVGVAPSAIITFASKLYPGSISVKAIVEQSGLSYCCTEHDSERQGLLYSTHSAK